MSDFRQVNDRFWASPQISLDDLAEAKRQGFALIVNNRPEGEVPDQPLGHEMEAAARAAGLDYCAIPVAPGGFKLEQVEAMEQALAHASGPVLAFCRSGTRSTLLWALAEAKRGQDPAAISAEATGAGYDLSPIRSLLDQLSSQA